MKLINTLAILNAAFLATGMNAFSVSSQNIMRLNDRLMNNRNNRDLKESAEDLSRKGTDITTSPQITFNNTLPNRFQIDLPENETRPNIVKILYQPIFTTNKDDNLDLDIAEEHRNNRINNGGSFRSDKNEHLRFESGSSSGSRSSDNSENNEYENNNQLDNNNIPFVASKANQNNNKFISVLKNQHPSTTKKKKQILLLVKGALDHREDRDRLRNYYADVNSPKHSNLNYDIQLKFLVGRAAMSGVDSEVDMYQRDQTTDGWTSTEENNDNSTTITTAHQKDLKILKESKQFNDIIIGDFFDNYENLVLKSLLGLEWYTGLDSIERPEYLLMVDDDVDVRLNDLVALIRNKENERSDQASSKDKELPGEGPENPLLLCPWKNARKARVSRRGPWAVPVKSYPATHWPSYCGGACYLMNYDAAKRLHDSAKKVIAIDVPIEDAFITGVLRERADFDLESTRPVCVHNYKRESVTGQFVEGKQAVQL